ncbi:TfoX-like protein [Rhodococcus sp. SMB37]|uniref:TfoX/Sxy family protein n=1 Tax=Rhodococcus sp. SMB37 TaxID=2512213 RepID=UPI0006D0AC6E|nr:TfoX/Sxy family protein [Rhodococcus sp. SMB37]TCN54763.1 TfoX-like protein [Rhodococcus sp. SMB37]
MTAAQTALIERLRELLDAESVTREVSMFGGRAFMVDEKMVVSALKDGGLLVRVAADRHDELLSRPGATQAEMGAGRTMGPGWIDVAAEAIRDDESLSYWVAIAMDHNRLARGKAAVKARTGARSRGV